MFAPTTIQVRYDDGGALAAGAAGAGRSQDYAQQKASDMAFVNAEANRRQQADLFAQQQQANQLQMAGRLALARIQGNPTNTTANSSRLNSPFTQAVQFAKQQAINGAIANGDVDQTDPEINLAARSPDVNAEQFLTLIEKRKKAKADESAVKQDTSAKQAVVDAAGESIDPGDADTIKGYVSDPKLSIDGLRKVITESQRRRTARENSTKLVQNRALSQQLTQGRASATAALAQAKAIEKAHPEIDFDGSPSQFGPEEHDALNVYLAHAKLKHQAEALASQNEALAAGNASYEDGTVLHSASTGRVFKVVNGQLQEITDNGSANAE
jgi:hypothetical protein